MKSWSVLMLVGVLALSGCGGKPGDNDKSTSSKTSSSKTVSSKSSVVSSSKSSSTSSKSVATSSSVKSGASSSRSSLGVICPAVYMPVCAVKLEPELRCITAPCPTGHYKTFGNKCEANGMGAAIAFDGECGDKEGQPVYGGGIACESITPVCGTAVINEPCLISPCPKVVHKTYANSCELDAVKARSLKQEPCGELENKPVDFIPAVACLAIYKPVCGKHKSDALECASNLCKAYGYHTYGNACELSGALADYVSEGECGNLPSLTLNAHTPARLVATLDDTDVVTVLEAKIVGDVLNVSLGYGGCGAQHAFLNVQNSFLESSPVQMKFVFNLVEKQLCKALINSQHVYDLSPLKYAYQKAYNTTAGEISLGKLGLYKF